jgi:hypothetical protein
MTAFLYDPEVTEVVTAPAVGSTAFQAPALRVVRDGEFAARPAQVARRIDIRSVFAGDPLLDGAALLLSIPIRHLYAALWRAGVLEVRA